MRHHLAQINVARLIAPVDDPRIAAFMNQLDSINALAEDAPGFVWRLKSEGGNATDIPYNDDPLVIVNMSVWESVEALRNYTYSSKHREVMKDRGKWFERHAVPHYCLWWVEAGHYPNVRDGRKRLEHYQVHGATPHSFWFSQEFPAPELEAVLA